MRRIKVPGKMQKFPYSSKAAEYTGASMHADYLIALDGRTGFQVE